MKNVFIILFLVACACANTVKATELRPLNVQNARMDTENKNELRINFDWIHNNSKGQVFGIPAEININDISVPRVNYRHTFDTIIPTRVGLSTGLSASNLNLEIAEEDILSRSAFGFQNMGLTLEAGIVQKEDLAVAIYINQLFPFTHNPLTSVGNLIPVYGLSAYGFQTGAEYQFDLGKRLALYGDVGYRFDAPKDASMLHSMVYYNEGILSLGKKDNFGLSFGVLGHTFLNDNVDFTDLRLVPGLILGVGEEKNQQLRLGFPIGLNATSSDFGVQASYFSLF